MTTTLVAAEEPTASLSAAATFAPPEIALISAVPDCPFPTNWTVATPLMVRASDGESAPRFVVKLTVVPFCTGVPDASSTVARISAVTLACTVEVLLVTVIVDAAGANSGTLSHEIVSIPMLAANAHALRFPERRRPVMMECIRIKSVPNYHIPMNLAAKASRGYAMAALLVAMSVMAVLLSAALPAWSHMIRREKEEELIFRGGQYARAINQYQRKFANASPASLDLLIEQRLLRKKFRDPLSPNEDGEFQLLYLNNEGTSARGEAPGGAAGNAFGTKPTGGILGVASKNTGQSIRIYKEKTHYNEWQFVGTEQTTQAGTGGGAAGGRGADGRGGAGGGGRGGWRSRR